MRGPRRDTEDHETRSAAAASNVADDVRAIEFVRRWIPYGGADTYEIFVTFGLTPAEFGRRLHRAMSSPSLALAGTAEVDREAVEREIDRLRGVGSRLSSEGA